MLINKDQKIPVVVEGKEKGVKAKLAPSKKEDN